MGKTHYAHVERANESDNNDCWSATACGLEYTESEMTDNPKNVTCKNCLRVMAKCNKKATAALPINSVSTRYLDDDVVLTTDDEFFFYWEVKKHNLTVKEKATEKEAAGYIKEFAHWQKEEQENIAAANYGSSYGC